MKQLSLPFDGTKIVKDEAGNVHWYNKNGQLHREDGPAVEYANGSKWWYLNGNLIKRLKKPNT